MNRNKHVTLMEEEIAPRLPPRKPLHTATHTPLCDAQHTLHNVVNNSANERQEVCMEPGGSECVWREESEESEEPEDVQVLRRCSNCRRRVEGAVISREELHLAIQDVQKEIQEAQGVHQAWEPLEDLPVGSLQDHVDAIRLFEEELLPLSEKLDCVNVLAHQLCTSGACLTEHNARTLHDLNTDWRLLQECIEERLKDLQEAQTQHVLTGSVQSPWERAVSDNNVPYYINHSTHSTSWDHPRLLELHQSMANLSEIKFSAYRTAMKLRCVQKALKLDRIPLSSVMEEVQRVTMVVPGSEVEGSSCSRVVEVQEVTEVLTSLYERVQEKEGVALNVPLRADMSLNWLLGVYDSGRTGKLRPLSLITGLVCLCDADFKDKCSYLFRQVCGSDGRCDAAHLRLLLHELLQIPRRLGEAAAFGGTNVEPSVASCLRTVSGSLSAQESDFLGWMALEPQSLVWLPVLQRVGQSERTPHQIRCSVCRRCPIIGFRYRSLKQFNVDICQSCFLTGRAFKTKTLHYPIIEYYTKSTSGEKMRDFAETLKNKFRSKEYFSRHPQRGYLPVQSTVRQGEEDSSYLKPPHSDSSAEHFPCSDDECYPCPAPNPDVPPASPLLQYSHTPTGQPDSSIFQPSHNHAQQDPPIYTNLPDYSHAHLPKSPAQFDSPFYTNLPKYSPAHSNPPLYTNLPNYRHAYLPRPLYTNIANYSHAHSVTPPQTPPPHNAFLCKDGHTHPLYTPHSHIAPPICTHLTSRGHAHSCQPCPGKLQKNVTFLEEQIRLLQGEHQRLQWQRAELEALVQESLGSRGEKIRLERQMHTLQQHIQCLESHLQHLQAQLLQARDDCENSVSAGSPASSCSSVPRPPRAKSPDPTGGCGLSEGRGHANNYLQQCIEQMRIE